MPERWEDIIDEAEATWTRVTDADGHYFDEMAHVRAALAKRCADLEAERDQARREVENAHELGRARDSIMDHQSRRVREMHDEVSKLLHLQTAADILCGIGRVLMTEGVIREGERTTAGIRKLLDRVKALEALTQTQAHYHATLRQRHEADRREIERVEGERGILERALVRIRDLHAVGVEQHAAAAALTAALEAGPDA